MFSFKAIKKKTFLKPVMETTEQNAADRRKVKTPMTGTTTDETLLMLSTNPNSFMLYSKFISSHLLLVQLVSRVIKTAYKMKINVWVYYAFYVHIMNDRWCFRRQKFSIVSAV